MALEIKLSQGAKPGLGGMLPGAKVTPRSPASAASRWARTAPLPAQRLPRRRLDARLRGTARHRDRTAGRSRAPWATWASGRSWPR
ncbi:glutamate synthase-related protein [Streptomyces sp. KL116D]|uniref:glutamate synthase-related protein n=1 Tax=Streptomyces sp. KL116D TaxID=3045152 RepID=UPI003558B84B